MNKFTNLLLAAGFALTTALGCDYRESEETVDTQEQPAAAVKSIDSLLQFYLKGDQELKKLKEGWVGVDRQDALEQAGYKIDPNVLAYQYSAPQLPELDITCHYGNLESGTIRIEADNERLSIQDSINYGGWGGVTFVIDKSLRIGEGPLNWQWSWNLLRNDLQSNEIKERGGVGFDQLCKYKSVGRYQRMFNSPGFYCVGDADDDRESEKFARAVLFLKGVQEMVCGE